jgi:four helix bundle protein
MDLVDAIYKAVECFPKTETYRLAQQMRAAAGSIPSNIAEGKGRRTDRDYRHFVIQARGSAYELETQVLISQRQHFLDDETTGMLLAAIAQTCRAINGLIRYLDREIGDREPDA